MTGALLSAALAVLLWPDRRAERWRRRAALLDGPVARGGVRAAPLVELPIPLLVVAGAVGAAAVLSTPLVAVLAGLLALVGARAWTAVRRDRAEESLLASLGEGLGALTADLRSGRPLAAAISSAVTACGSEESGRALARAVRAPGSAVRPEDFRDDVVASALDRLSAAVLLSTRTGCSLADVVAAVDEDLRARRRHRHELRSATAAPRASAMLLAGLPALGLAMGSGIGADPWRVLTGTGTGQVLLVAGVALEIAGLAWSRRLVERVLR